MRDATCQEPNTLQFLCLPQTFFRSCALGDVTQNDHVDGLA
jgi:hypothetical protein